MCIRCDAYTKFYQYKFCMLTSLQLSTSSSSFYSTLLLVFCMHTHSLLATSGSCFPFQKMNSKYHLHGNYSINFHFSAVTWHSCTYIVFTFAYKVDIFSFFFFFWINREHHMMHKLQRIDLSKFVKVTFLLIFLFCIVN